MMGAEVPEGEGGTEGEGDSEAAGLLTRPQHMYLVQSRAATQLRRTIGTQCRQDCLTRKKTR